MFKQNLLVYIFLGLSICCISYAWTELSGTMPSSYNVPINTDGVAQTKSGSLTIGGDLNVSGKSNICQIVAFTDSGTQAKCPTGYYVAEMVASAASGNMLCCKVNNPLN